MSKVFGFWIWVIEREFVFACVPIIKLPGFVDAKETYEEN
jgi:hypothetical protein